jgi:hypothetical protein
MSIFTGLLGWNDTPQLILNAIYLFAEIHEQNVPLVLGLFFTLSMYCSKAVDYSIINVL